MFANEKRGRLAISLSAMVGATGVRRGDVELHAPTHRPGLEGWKRFLQGSSQGAQISQHEPDAFGAVMAEQVGPGAAFEP